MFFVVVVWAGACFIFCCLSEGVFCFLLFSRWPRHRPNNHKKHASARTTTKKRNPQTIKNTDNKQINTLDTLLSQAVCKQYNHLEPMQFSHVFTPALEGPVGGRGEPYAQVAVGGTVAGRRLARTERSGRPSTHI